MLLKSRFSEFPCNEIDRYNRFDTISCTTSYNYQVCSLNRSFIGYSTLHPKIHEIYQNNYINQLFCPFETYLHTNLYYKSLFDHDTIVIKWSHKLQGICNPEFNAALTNQDKILFHSICAALFHVFIKLSEHCFLHYLFSFEDFYNQSCQYCTFSSKHIISFYFHTVIIYYTIRISLLYFIFSIKGTNLLKLDTKNIFCICRFLLAELQCSILHV